MSRLIVLVLAMLSIITQVHSQFHETIRTGRPGQGIGPYVIGEGVSQLQSGLEYYRTRYEGQLPELRQLVHNSIFRFGHTEQFEWNALVNWQADSPKGESAELALSGLEVGFRVNVLRRRGAIPALGLQYRLLLPFESEPYRRAHLGSRMIVSTMNKLWDKVNLVGNLSLTWSGNSESPHTGYTLSVSGDLTKRWGTFAEVYGSLSDFSAYLDGGFSYLLNPDLQLDIFGGIQNEDGKRVAFVSAGVSWRWVGKNRSRGI